MMLDHPFPPAEPPEILRAAAAVVFDLDAKDEDVRMALGQIVANVGSYDPWRGLTISETARALLHLARCEGIREPITAIYKGQEAGRLKLVRVAFQKMEEGEEDTSPEMELNRSKHRRDQEPEL